MKTRPINNKTLSYMVPSEIYQDFQAFCLEKQWSQADVIRLAIKRVADGLISFASLRNSALVSDFKTSVALTKSELDLVDQISKANGVRRGGVLRLIVCNHASILHEDIHK